jgi:DNA-binding NarL/FixJ family response regulator
MTEKIKVLIVDDHAILRAGLRMLLESQADIAVIGEAGDGHETLQKVDDLRPDLVLLDLTLPKLSGLEILPLLKRNHPKVQILVLTMHDDESYLRQALSTGAAGYVLKKAADIELISAIHAVVQGEFYIHPSMTKVLLNDIIQPTTSDNPWELLSEREREVLIRVAHGLTSAKIAEELNLSPKTVETYRARGMEKLGLRSRAALVQFALAHHLFSS